MLPSNDLFANYSRSYETRRETELTLAEYLAVQVDHFAKTFRNQVSDPVGDRAPVTPPDHDHVDQVIEVQQVNDVLDVRREGDRVGIGHMSSFG